MKKIFSLLLMALLTTVGMRAQMIAYDVTTATSELTELTGATIVDLQGTTGTDLSGLALDADGNMEFNTADELKGFPIGFNFNYNGQMMTHFLINTDLKLQLSAKETITTDFHKKDNMVAYYTTEGIHDVIGISPREGVYGLDDTQISYITTGSEGNRVLTVEYKNIDFGNGGGWGTENEYCGTKATIQFRLYEQSGNIEMQVSGMKPTEPGRYNFMRVGILGSSKDFVQVQAWDGSVVSARDNSISYNADNYPQDGTVYTFVAPEPCQTPTAAPADLVLSSTTTQISGTFTIGNGDHYIVLATTEAALSAKPADGTKYSVGDAIGNAKVIAITENGEFTGTDNMEQGTWNVFVFAYNSMCMNGPLYGSDAATAAIAMKPGAPTALSVASTDKNVINLTAQDCGAQMVIAMTEQQHFNDIQQGYPYGEFGTPTGAYTVGQEIEGGGKVVYIGTTGEVVLKDLEPGKTYFFRAWSTDGKGGYSSQWLDLSAVTAAELPWQPALEQAPVSEMPFGWTINSEDYQWYVNDYLSYYLVNKVNFLPDAGTAETWTESPYIYLNEGSNWLSVDVAANSIPVRWASDWEMTDGDKIAVQLTTDGVNYKDLIVLNKDNMPTFTDPDTSEEVKIWKNGEFSTFRVNFSDYAGQKVKVRLYVKRATKGEVDFSNLKIEGTLYGIVGDIPGLTWDNDLFMTQSADNKNVYTVSLDVDVAEVPAEPYKYKLRANQNWEGYQIPTQGDQYWQPTEAGTYHLVFTADVAQNNLTLAVERPFSVSFDNKGNWSEVYAYTWTYDPETKTTTEYSGAWPGTLVERSGFGFNRSWTYNFTAEQQPQNIIWNNGGGHPEWDEPAEQTADLVFVNGKKYSYFPEITSVKISGSWNNWDGPEMEVTEYNPSAFQTTVNLTGYTTDQEFKLVVNGQWIGSGELVAIEGDAASCITQGDAGSNLKLQGGKAYDIVAFWSEQSANVKNGWLLEIVENTTVSVAAIKSVNAEQQPVYNLNGQRIAKMQHGVNIVGGKKIVVK